MNKYMMLAATSALLALATSPLAAKNSGNPNSGGGNANSGGGNANSGGGNANSGGGNANSGGGNTNGGGGQASGPRVCLLSDVSPTAVACTGFFAGNLLNNSSVAEQISALNTLGFAWDGNFTTVSKINSLNGGTIVDFGNADSNPIDTLYGDTWVGLHFGAGGPTGIGQQGTAFFKIVAGLNGLSSFILNITTGSSGAVLYKTGSAPIGGGGDGGDTGGAVPEPASWAMLIADFGLIGAAARRRRAVAIA